MANRELVAQALVNLIENALKYGQPEDGQPLAITLKLEQVHDRIAISVADNGRGIEEKDRGRVLDRFVRLEESRTEPGYGLGLSLVKAIARLHGGSLALGDAGPGLVARIDLPAAQVDMPGGARRDDRSREAGSRS
ncbi:sensor histidine kinase [Pannonibacter phragmitetus]|uniref:sensor histidine kinase n=1 Tax=Pannonibacter phragmitetus TaxID=121719 RepID=UPI003D2F1999